LEGALAMSLMFRSNTPFFTEGILERKRQEISECFGCCDKDNNTWRWYPRQEIDHVQVDNESHSKCCGYCHNGHCCTGWCAKSHTLVDIVTREEAASGVNETAFGGFGGVKKRVSLKLTPDEAESFFVYCQNYTYNTNYHAGRIYNMEFLKAVTSEKYDITPSDWVNYYLSTSGEVNRPPVGYPTYRGSSGGGMMGGGGSGGGGGGGGGGSCGSCGGCAKMCCSCCG